MASFPVLICLHIKMITRRITSTTMATHRPSTTAVKWMEYIWNYANSKYRLNTAEGDILNAYTLVPCHTRKWVEYTWTCIAPHAQHSCRINASSAIRLQYVYTWSMSLSGPDTCWEWHMKFRCPIEYMWTCQIYYTPHRPGTAGGQGCVSKTLMSS